MLLLIGTLLLNNGFIVSQSSMQNFTPSNPTWSSSGRYVAFQHLTTASSEIWAVNTETLTVFNISEKTASQHPVWAPHEDYLAYIVTQNEIHVVDIKGNIIVKISDNQNYIPPTFSWSQDGSKIAFESINAARMERHLHVAHITYFPETQIEITTLFSDIHYTDRFIPNWLSENSLLFTVSQDGITGLKMYNLRTNQISAFNVSGLVHLGIASPDGNNIAVLANTECTNGLSIIVIDLLLNSESTILKCRASILPLKWSPDSQAIAGFILDSDDLHIGTYNFDFSDQWQIVTRFSETLVSSGFSWSPNSESIAVTVDLGLWIVDLASNTQTQIIQ